MGLTDAFNEHADFTGISKKPLRLDEVYVRTHFSLNENGINVEVSNSKFPLIILFISNISPSFSFLKKKQFE